MSFLAHIQIKQGQRPSSKGSPVQDLPQKVQAVRHAAILGVDYQGFRPAMEVAIADHVTAGQVVCRDRNFSNVAIVAPISGRVASIDHGPRRTLSAIVIENGVDAALSQSSAIDVTSDEIVRQTLLEKGMWPAFRTRPFGQIPHPESKPAAIFINTTRTSLLAPDPRVVLKQKSDDFHAGVDLLTRLTDGKIYVCQAPGEALCQEAERVQIAYFSGNSASGLSGTHINRLHRARIDKQVWSIGYQDVAAIGYLFRTGNYSGSRVVSIAGSQAAKPRLIETCLGASLREACDGEVRTDTKQTTQIFSGAPLTGRDAAFLGRFHDQITIAEKATHSLVGNWLFRAALSQGAIIPTDVLESALAIDVLPVPLMRALSIGDADAAESLGCLELVEEDVALLSRLCTSGSDYGVLLRQVLNELMEDAA